VGHYVPHTDDEIASMLEFVGVSSMDELFVSIPEALRLAAGEDGRHLDLPDGLSEFDTLAEMERLGDRNSMLTCFAGAGAYDHDIASATKRLAFRTIVPDGAIRMTSDVDKIRQILVNLAGNAVKFTDAGEVRLELCRREGHVCFSVCDTGIGIAPADRDRLFKPFAQLDTGLTRRHGGTGLGLYISRALAELLGGTIEVESQHGKGSTFTLVLPTDPPADSRPGE
jgi:signal transduction histidine kinase